MNGRSPQAAIPALDRLLARPEILELSAASGREQVRSVLRDLAAELREAIGRDGHDALPPDVERWFADTARARLAARAAPTLKRVFNLSGTVLHTNLGRAPLPREAIDAMCAAAGASNLEMDLASGRRGDRDDHVEVLLRELTGAEAATVVNNNAAAVLLVLNSLALRREVPVSRGELIEIGGAFRMPDIMSRAGCRLVEVGTTNRTHRHDFEQAIRSRTALLMKVHTSNYEVRGFTASVDQVTLAEVAHEHGLPCIDDLGSGSLVDLTRFGLPAEPTPRAALEAGVDLVTFSGDKLLGGPQCGIVVGRADLVARVKRNPMKRAMRLDKVTIAALAAVLRLYLNPERIAERIPGLRQLARSEVEIDQLATRLAADVSGRLAGRVTVAIARCESQIGSGALPLESLASRALCLRPEGRRGTRAAERLAGAFRALPVPVVGRVRDDALWLDLRCLEDEAGFLAQLDVLDVVAPC